MKEGESEELYAELSQKDLGEIFVAGHMPVKYDGKQVNRKTKLECFINNISY